MVFFPVKGEIFIFLLFKIKPMFFLSEQKTQIPADDVLDLAITP